MAEKTRAERNRTLTVSENEIPALEKSILSADDLKNHLWIMLLLMQTYLIV